MFRYEVESGHLIYLPQDLYQPDWMKVWARNDDQIQSFLDVAQSHLLSRIKEMGLDDGVGLMRKSRAVGVHPKSGFKLSREQLDELALSGIGQVTITLSSTQVVRLSNDPGPS